MSYSAFKLIAPGSDGKSIRNTITFEGHPFVPGDVVRYFVPTSGNAGNGWTAAIATSAQEAEVAGVVESATDNTFTVVYGGEISTTLFPNASSLNENDVYFLSDTDGGKLVSTPPIEGGHVIKPVLTVVSDGTAIVTNYIGTNIGGRATVSLDSVQPVGTIMSYAGNPINLPSSWELCDGGFLDINEYSELYDKIGTVFGRRQRLTFSTVIDEGDGTSPPGSSDGGGGFGGDNGPPEGSVYSISVGDTLRQTLESGTVTGVVHSVDTATNSVVVTVDHLDPPADENERPHTRSFLSNRTVTFDDATETLTVTTAELISFAKPNLSLRFLLGSSGDNYPLGSEGGLEEIILSKENLPANVYTFGASTNVVEGSITDPILREFSETGNGQPTDNMPPYLTLNYIIRVNSYARASYIDGLDIDISMGGLSDSEDVTYRSGDILIFDESTGPVGGQWRPYKMFDGFSGDDHTTLLYSFPGQKIKNFSYQRWSSDSNGQPLSLILDGITYEIKLGQLQVGRSWNADWASDLYADPRYNSHHESSSFCISGDLTMNTRNSVGPSRLISSHTDYIWGNTLDYIGACNYWFGENALGVGSFGSVDQNGNRLLPLPPNQIDLNYQAGYFLGADSSNTSYAATDDNLNDKLGYYTSIMMSSLNGIHLCVDHNQSVENVGESNTPGDGLFTIGIGGLGYGPTGPNSTGYNAFDGTVDGKYHELFRIEGETGRAGFFGYKTDLFRQGLQYVDWPNNSRVGVGISGGFALRHSTHPIDEFVQNGISPSLTSSYLTRHKVPTVYAVNVGLYNLNTSLRSYVNTTVNNAIDNIDTGNSDDPNTISGQSFFKVNPPRDSTNYVVNGLDDGYYFVQFTGPIFGDVAFRAIGTPGGAEVVVSAGHQTSGGDVVMCTLSLIVEVNGGSLTLRTTSVAEPTSRQWVRSGQNGIVQLIGYRV